MKKNELFFKQIIKNINKLKKDTKIKKQSFRWIRDSAPFKYSYNFSWLGRPIIQYPQDIIAMQEIIWNVKPDCIIETGIAHGGSLIFYASMMQLIRDKGKVIGIDIDIRKHNRIAIEKHPLSKRIDMIQGSSVDKNIVNQVYKKASKFKRVLLVLDSNHTHEHVLMELEYFSPLVSKGSYIVVFDTIIEYMPNKLYQNRPWGKGNNPKTAVNAFLKKNVRFVPDRDIEAKLLITVAPGGFLKCIKD